MYTTNNLCICTIIADVIRQQLLNSTGTIRTRCYQTPFLSAYLNRGLGTRLLLFMGTASLVHTNHYPQHSSTHAHYLWQDCDIRHMMLSPRPSRSSRTMLKCCQTALRHAITKMPVQKWPSNSFRVVIYSLVSLCALATGASHHEYLTEAVILLYSASREL